MRRTLVKLFAKQPLNGYIRAITREIDPSLTKYALRQSQSEIVDFNKAQQQHNKLLQIMKKIGIEIVTLSPDGYPDSVFIEDTAVVIDDIAFITNPGAVSRQGETNRVKEFFELNTKYKVVKQLDGTLDGGDVLYTGI